MAAKARFGDKRISEFLWSKFKVDEATGCWLYQLALNNNGYGFRTVYPASGKRTVGVHRIFYEALVGPVPEGLQLDHVRARGCVHRHCANPAHLEPVSGRVNKRRGTGLCAQNAVKTHCPQSHPYSVENTYWEQHRNGPRRHCVTCRARRIVEYNARHRKVDQYQSISLAQFTAEFIADFLL